MRNKLTKDQRSELLKWVAEGLESDEINKRAAKFELPFSVSRAQVDYYRKTRKVSISELSQSAELDALKSGLALKEERVKRLDLLAGLIEEDLFSGVLWVQDVKMIGTGENQERVEFETFNASEVQQYRGILEDIAKEVGDRVQKTDVTSNGKTIKVTVGGEELPEDE
jgi:hypothetical protein